MKKLAVISTMAFINIAFIATVDAQTVIGSGALQRIPVFTTNPTGSTIGNSQITDDTDVKIATGSFELTTTSKSFNIGSATPVLWHKGNSTNIFVGVGLTLIH